MEEFSGDDIASLIYLGLFTVALTGAYLTQSRLKLSQVMQQAAIWVCIFLGAIAIAGMWPTIDRALFNTPQISETSDQIIITLPRQPDGHFYVTLQVNQVPLRFLIDTGATNMVLRRRDAERVGFDVANLSFTGRSFTANGEVSSARVRLDEVRLGPLSDVNVPATVNGGELFENLLGMSYLETFGRIVIEGDALRLTR